MELLAQVVEEVSVLAAEQRRKDPVKVPRPKHLRSGGDVVMWGGPDPERVKVAAEVAKDPERGPDPSYGNAMGMLAGSAGARVKVARSE